MALLNDNMAKIVDLKLVPWSFYFCMVHDNGDGVKDGYDSNNREDDVVDAINEVKGSNEVVERGEGDNEVKINK